MPPGGATCQADEATYPMRSTLVESQSVLGDFQEDEVQLKKIPIQVEGKSISPGDATNMGMVKETRTVCLRKAIGER